MAERTSRGTFAKGNAAHRTHGVYSFLALGRMPNGCRKLRSQLGQMRTFLENEIRRRSGAGSGEIPAREAVLIHAAVSHEARRRLLSWWLAGHADDMTTDQFHRNQADQAAALAARDRCLLSLFPGPDGPGLDLAALLGGLDGPQANANGSTAPGGPEGATGQTGAGNGMGGSQGVA